MLARLAIEDKRPLTIIFLGGSCRSATRHRSCATPITTSVTVILKMFAFWVFTSYFSRRRCNKIFNLQYLFVFVLLHHRSNLQEHFGVGCSPEETKIPRERNVSSLIQWWVCSKLYLYIDESNVQNYIDDSKCLTRLSKKEIPNRIATLCFCSSPRKFASTMWKLLRRRSTVDNRGVAETVLNGDIGLCEIDKCAIMRY